MLTIEKVVEKKNVYTIVGDGEDRWGPFTINGASNKDEVEFVKLYQSNTRWVYRGKIDCFGMCGIWGEQSWGGPFRIWLDSTNGTFESKLLLV